MDEHRHWMQLVVANAAAAEAAGDAPIAAMVVQKGEVLSAAHNTKTSQNVGYAHAELNAILAAGGKLGRHPEGVILYSTLEPCAMCLGAAIFAGIRTVVYGADDPDGGAVAMLSENVLYREWMPTVVPGILREECEQLRLRAQRGTSGGDST